MRFHHFTLDNCKNATGLVIVIDVLRAFSTAAYAFSAGADVIHLTSKVEDAFAMKEQLDHSRIMGEVDGLQVDGFDYGNSPAQFDGVDLSGTPLIQRTTSGTQGVVESILAEKLMTASFCNASATVRYIERLSPKDVNFVITGVRPGGFGDEDQACAEYIEALLSNQSADPGPYLDRVKNSTPGQLFLNPDIPEYPSLDLEYCLKVNKFDFAMTVSSSDKHLRMKSYQL